MINRLCASCGRNTERRGGAVRPYGVHVHVPDGRSVSVAVLCSDCADPARFSVEQLSTAIHAEFARQLSPKASSR